MICGRTPPTAIAHRLAPCSRGWCGRENDRDPSAARRAAGASAPVEVPGDIEERVRPFCLALPEVAVRVDESRTGARSTARSFDIRRRSFCLLVAVKGRTGKPVPLLVLRADPDDREALVSIGHPDFAGRAGRSHRGAAHRRHGLGGDPSARDRELPASRSEEAHRTARLAAPAAREAARDGRQRESGLQCNCPILTVVSASGGRCLTPAWEDLGVGSPQTLSEADRRIVAVWAADCAERVLGLFEAEAPGDGRPRDAIVRLRAFARGELGVGEARRRFVAHAAARDVSAPKAVAAARAAGQAASIPHMGAHALGAAAYAAKAAGLAAPDTPEAVSEEIRWQLGRISPEARAALRQLPPVGENASGPLGPGLLASGLLGTIIRELQASLTDPDRGDFRVS
jgi:hypothetical protein